MTSMTMVERDPTIEAGWGERQERHRDRRRRKRVLTLVAAVVLAAVGIPFLFGFVDGLLGRPIMPATATERLLTALGLVGSVSLLGSLHWRDLDEVQRGQAARVLAVIGLVSLLAHPVLGLAQPTLHLSDPETTAWTLSLAAGAATLTYQKVHR